MADLKNHEVYKNDRFEVLTDEGFKDFKGIIIGNNTDKLILTFEQNIKLVCTSKHKITLTDKTFRFAKDLITGDSIYSGVKLISKEQITNNEPVYELLEVKDTHRYFVNDILSQQCLLIDEAAFIPPEFMNDFWESVFPVISSSKKSKIFMLSTPNGVGNLFYNIYTESLDNSNGWHNERVDWWEVPGRDEKWRDMTAKALGSVDAFSQEYGNEFRAAGENALDSDLMLEFEKTAPEPLLVSEDECYKIFVERKPQHFYTIGVDVGDGIGRANSAIQILDITDLTSIEQVATYANNRLDPFNFAARLVEIAHEWGRPPLLVERNNCGAQVVDALVHTHNYESLIKYTPSMGTFTEKADKDNRMGVYSHTNSKFNAMTNLRYWMSTLKCLKLNDKETINEFKTYVKQANGVWKKQSDRYLDDRVESLIWALFALDLKVVEQFYEVVEKDGNGKPLKIQPLDWDPFRAEITNMPSQQDLYTRYVKGHQPDVSIRNPTIMSNKPGNNSEVDELFDQGWKPLGFNGASGRMRGGMF